MARPIGEDPENPGGPGYDPPTTPGEPGYVPPTAAGTAIAFVVITTAATITSEQIAAAGGPWENYTVRVTPINDYGSGAPQQISNFNTRVTEAGDTRITEAQDVRISDG